MTDIEKLKKLTGEGDDILLSLLLDEATAFVLSYTGRTKIVTGLEKAVRDLAVIALNRMGTEGEASRSGGGGGRFSAAFCGSGGRHRGLLFSVSWK